MEELARVYRKIVEVGADLVSARNEEDVGARCIVPKVNRNNTKAERAQFIVPLQNHKNRR